MGHKHREKTMDELALQLTLKPSEVERLTGIPLTTIMEAIHQEGLVAYQPTPRRYRVNRVDLDAWLRSGMPRAGGAHRAKVVVVQGRR